MRSIRGTFSITLLCIVMLAAVTDAPAAAGTADHWYLSLGAAGSHRVLARRLAMDPRSMDGYDGDPAAGDLSLRPKPTLVGIALPDYRVQGTDWTGATGFYGGNLELTPIVPGGSKTWPSSTFGLRITHRLPPISPWLLRDGISLAPPAGYRGHPVLDYVSASCNWTGPMDIWLEDLRATTPSPCRFPWSRTRCRARSSISMSMRPCQSRYPSLRLSADWWGWVGLW